MIRAIMPAGRVQGKRAGQGDAERLDLFKQTWQPLETSPAGKADPITPFLVPKAPYPLATSANLTVPTCACGNLKCS